MMQVYSTQQFNDAELAEGYERHRVTINTTQPDTNGNTRSSEHWKQ